MNFIGWVSFVIAIICLFVLFFNHYENKMPVILRALISTLRTRRQLTKLTKIFNEYGEFIEKYNFRFFYVWENKLDIWVDEHHLEMYTNLNEFIVAIETTLPKLKITVHAHQGREITYNCTFFEFVRKTND